MAIPDRRAPALIFAPVGRDAQIAASLLEEAGVPSHTVPDLAALLRMLGEDVSLAVVTEEALRFADLRELSAWVTAQPSWSDLPFILLTQRGGGPERNPAAARLSGILGNVSFLERPFHATTFISMARSALRGRRRQYQARLQIEALDESERRLQTALQAGHLGAWELDMGSLELTASETFRRIFGRGPDAGFGYHDMIDAIAPDDSPGVRRALEATIETGADLAIEVRLPSPGGAVRWVEMRAQIYRELNGLRIRIIGVCADVTERRRNEESQRQINEMLEERVAARTAELETAHADTMAEIAQRQRAEEQLRQAQKMEAIGQLTGGVAHDFNNLLMAVLGNLELLHKHAGDDPKAIRLIDGAIQGARRGASLTQRLLAFARRQDLHVTPIDIKKLVGGMEELLQRSVGTAINMEIDLPDGLPPAMADANQLELALLNLAVNARDAMAEGGTLRIGLRRDEGCDHPEDLDEGSYVVLSVTDNGKGMDEDTLKKAIDPFFSTKELGKGTGLGLSMIHGLAIQMKGMLKLESRVGQGTTAELWIPSAGQDLQSEVPAAEAAVPAPDAKAARAEPLVRRILMVDDDVLIAMSSVDMLEDLGHQVVEANSGEQALDILASGQPFDLIITDYSMPRMTGAELAREARRMRPEIPILIATGYAELPAGTELNLPRLSKPYSQDQLSAEIDRALASSPEAAAAASPRQ
ncbi:hybrid sensor histidine kinase/response regulator [Hoeflea sp. BAL378]|uniref:hybrid sensor histidine kinase/response regulator n=1 Tax=Hoeflea sp. BAL378 TaxID=1547437 RepID=UPI00068B05B5|nr:hybrid sensor histidine kinase/response regulator [Hoeflea sp. BAL378]